MLRNYLTVAIRNLLRNKTYATVSIGGLAIGLAAVFLITLYVLHEMKYDTYHENGERIYRIYQSDTGRGSGNASTQPVLGTRLRTVFPEDVEKVVRIDGEFRIPMYLQWHDELLPMEGMYFAEPEIFSVFTIPLYQGDPATALTEPHTVVLSQRMAERYFADANPVGESLAIKWGSDFVNFKVTGVLEPIPGTSQIRPDFILPAQHHTLPDPSDTDRAEYWGYNNVRTYVLLSPGVDPMAFEEKLNASLESEWPEWFTRRFYLQSLERIHLYSARIEGNFGQSGNILYVYIFMGVAILILLISCFNHINLNTAIAVTRLKEVGIRKIVGARRTGLILQAFTESFLVSLLALPLALLMVELALPVVGRLLVGNMMEQTLAPHVFDDWSIIFIMLAIVALVGFLISAATAFYFASPRLANTLKDGLQLHNSRSWFRRLSISFQFIVFIALAASSLLFYKQLRYTQTKNLGYDQEQILAIQLPNYRYTPTCEVFREKVTQFPDIEAVTFASTLPPTFGNWGTTIATPNDEVGEEFTIRWIDTDGLFQETLQLEMVAGNYFPTDQFNEESSNIVINQAAASMFGLEQPVGQFVTISGYQCQVIGVLKDFHMRSLYDADLPLFISNRPRVVYMAVRVVPGNIAATLDKIKGTWDEVFPGEPIEYSFLDDAFDQVYRADVALGQLFGGFSSLAIFLACMGLFGLVTFAAERRTKEIGIRKVVGASVAQVVTLLSREFLVLVLVANVIAWPIAWYAMSRWLENFAYRIELGVGVFILAGLLALVIALATVSWQTIRAATANPVDSLRYE